MPRRRSSRVDSAQPPADRVPLRASTCPLCGGPNGCTPAQSGRFDGPACWCQDARFSAELLARVPAAQQGRACICAACAAAASSDPAR
ncbi:MAG: cysteine-rich CWC family protein [Burkholderiales bacterium]|nr:cysteine-rich CWC family protein [Burkholderiales bacterium]